MNSNILNVSLFLVIVLKEGKKGKEIAEFPPRIPLRAGWLQGQ